MSVMYISVFSTSLNFMTTSSNGSFLLDLILNSIFPNKTIRINSQDITPVKTNIHRYISLGIVNKIHPNNTVVIVL